MPRLQSRLLKLGSLGVGPSHQYFLKLPQMIPMCSKIVNTDYRFNLPATVLILFYVP